MTNLDDFYLAIFYNKIFTICMNHNRLAWCFISQHPLMKTVLILTFIHRWIQITIWFLAGHSSNHIPNTNPYWLNTTWFSCASIMIILLFPALSYSKILKLMNKTVLYDTFESRTNDYKPECYQLEMDHIIQSIKR